MIKNKIIIAVLNLIPDSMFQDKCINKHGIDGDHETEIKYCVHYKRLLKHTVKDNNTVREINYSIE